MTGDPDRLVVVHRIETTLADQAVVPEDLDGLGSVLGPIVQGGPQLGGVESDALGGGGGVTGAGVGALASQLGAVTVSSVPDDQTGEVGGLQNTLTNLGASIGTALAGAVLISALTASFLGSVQNNPAVPKELASKAQVELAAGIPFVSDKDLTATLEKAGVQPNTADAIVNDYTKGRIDGLRASMSVLGVIALIAVALSGRIPRAQPSSTPAAEP